MKLIKNYWPLLLIFLSALTAFKFIFGLYFTQDDFFHLGMSQVNNLGDFFRFFFFENAQGYTFYRPLTTQVYGFAIQSIFGLKPFYFHAAAFLLFLANITLVFKIAQKVIKKTNWAYLAAFLYAVSASNIGSLAYISAFQEIGVAFFFFLTFWLYLKGEKWAILAFILALLSKETAMTLPLIFVVYEILLGDKNWRKIIPYWLILAFYAILRVGSGLPDTSVYEPVFNLQKIANSYVWYFLWGLGLPEMLVDFVRPGLVIEPSFLSWYHREARIMFIALFLFTILLGIGTVRSFGKDKKMEVFWILWFLITLLPVVFWPWHKFSFYLTVPLLGLMIFLVLVLRHLPKVLMGVSVLLLVLTSVVTISLAERTYWVVTRARISENLVNDLKTQYPELPVGASLYFQNDPEYPFITSGWGRSSSQAYYVLSGANGPRLIYNDPTLKVYYEDLKKPPESETIFPVTAIISQ